MAISKTHGPEIIMGAYEAGQRVFGENKVQEMVWKHEHHPKDIEWHLVGHLQRNKVRHIAPFVSLIHSVDSLRLLQEISKEAIKNQRVIKCLLQVHIADEETKFGLDDAELKEIIDYYLKEEVKGVELCGLMGMATLTDDMRKISEEFQYLRGLFSTIKSEHLPHLPGFKELSMGMSSDYTIAIENGSTMVRIGSNIFGYR